MCLKTFINAWIRVKSIIYKSQSISFILFYFEGLTGSAICVHHFLVLKFVLALRSVCNRK